MATTTSVEELLRPLAEAVVPRETAREGDYFSERWTDPDPRFEALRCKHPRAYGHPHDGHTCCPDCGYESGESEGGIDASLGAILESAKACGYEVYRAVLEALLAHHHVSGMAITEVAARALVKAAVFYADEKATRLTGARAQES